MLPLLSESAMNIRYGFGENVADDYKGDPWLWLIVVIAVVFLGLCLWELRKSSGKD